MANAIRIIGKRPLRPGLLSWILSRLRARHAARRLELTRKDRTLARDIGLPPVHEPPALPRDLMERW